MAQNNINLMPEDLRSKEENAKAKNKNQVLQPDLSVPQTADKNIEMNPSGSETKKSFWSKITGSKKTKVETADFENHNFKPLPELPVKTEVEDMFAAKSMPESNVQMPSEEKVPVSNIMPEVKDDNHGFSLEPQPVVAAEPVKEEESEKDGKFHQPEKIIRARFVESGMGVDLVPTSAKVKSWKEVSTLIIISFIASIGLIFVFYFGLLTVDTSFSSNKANTLAEIENIKSQLLDFEDISKEINQTGREIASVYDLLHQHIYWTNFFDLLEKYTLEDVFYTGFAATDNGLLTLNASAPDYYSVAKQLKILQQEEANEFINKVEIYSASASDEGVAFSISLTLNPDLFYYQNNF